MRHVTEIKVRGYHVDAFGHVNNARWLELLEEARWRWLDEAVDLRVWDADGRGIAVLNIDVTYRRPALRHDTLVLTAWMTRMGGKACACRQQAASRETGEVLLDATVTFVLFDLTTGRARAVDGDSRERLGRYLEKDDDA
jgi:thioesterase III